MPVLPAGGQKRTEPGACEDCADLVKQTLAFRQILLAGNHDHFGPLTASNRGSLLGQITDGGENQPEDQIRVFERSRVPFNTEFFNHIVGFPQACCIKPDGQAAPLCRSSTSTVSRVVPGTGVTIARSNPVSALSSEIFRRSAAGDHHRKPFRKRRP
jgi:hypothetical protein